MEVSMKKIAVVTVLGLWALLFPLPANAEYEDLRTPEEKGEGNFVGFASSCAACWGSMSRSETKKAAVENAKNKGRYFCKNLGATGVEFSNEETTRIPDATDHKYYGKVSARCVFSDKNHKNVLITPSMNPRNNDDSTR